MNLKNLSKITDSQETCREAGCSKLAVKEYDGYCLKHYQNYDPTNPRHPAEEAIYKLGLSLDDVKEAFGSNCMEVVCLPDGDLHKLYQKVDDLLFDAYKEFIIGIFPDGSLIQVQGFRDPYTEEIEYSSNPVWDEYTFEGFETLASVVYEDDTTTLEEAKEAQRPKKVNYKFSRDNLHTFQEFLNYINK